MMNLHITKVEETEEELPSIEIKVGAGSYYSIYDKEELEELIKELEEALTVLKDNLRSW